MLGRKYTVLKKTMPLIFLFMTKANPSEQKIPIGIPIIRKKVLPTYFQKRWSFISLVKFSMPTQFGGVRISQSTKARIREARTGRDVKTRNPRKFGRRKR
jgi:hypothetical protein